MPIIIRDLQDKEMTIFNPDGTVLVVTHNMLCVNDVLLQIREQDLEGYTIKIEGRPVQIISRKGRIKGYFPHVFAEQLKQMFNVWENGLKE